METKARGNGADQPEPNCGEDTASDQEGRNIPLGIVEMG